jgi:signal transduction histidine kinase/CheY-like chemotaxis protein
MPNLIQRQLTVGFLLVTTSVAAQDLISLEQAASRSGRDLTAAYEGKTVAIRGQVASTPVWAVGTYYLPVHDNTDHGLILEGDRKLFSELEPGDWIEARGSIQARGGLPLLAPASIAKLRHEPAPDPKDLSVADLCSVRYLGLMVRTTATVTAVGENLGGKSLEITDRGSTMAVFLPRPSSVAGRQLTRLRVGDHVRLTGLATQYSLEPPHARDFQIMLAGPAGVEIVRSSWMMPPYLLLSALGGIGLVVLLWWVRERRLGINRRSMRAFHALSEEIVSAGSPAEIAEKLYNVLPAITQATGVKLYLYNKRTKSLECVPTDADPDPMAVAIDFPPAGLAGAAVVCFRNRTLLNVPDVRRSPFVKNEAKYDLPRSAMFVPLFAQHEILGVLEVGNARRLGYFTVEEQAAAQHLANQVAASLKLQMQQTIREQLFRSEKLAATGQLISGVASELRAPLDRILQLTTSLGAYSGRPVPEHALRQIAGESQRAAEIVSRLVSFARPEDAAAQNVDVHAIVASLMQFREPEWKTLGLRVQNRLTPEPALVLGAQGQLEQVFLNLLVHAEQCASEAPGKTISIASSLIGRRLTIEIGFSTTVERREAEIAEDGHSLEIGALGLGVCQGIVHSHGGEMRFQDRSGTARFEVELPLIVPEETSASGDSRKAAAPLTLLLVDSDQGGQRQLLALLSARGHRIVPAPAEEAADLAQRLRFDAVLWAMHPSGPRWSESQERIRSHVPFFVLVSDGYDAELARSLEASGGFLLARPIQDADLEWILKQIESRPQSAADARASR